MNDESRAVMCVLTSACMHDGCVCVCVCVCVGGGGGGGGGGRCMCVYIHVSPSVCVPIQYVCKITLSI